jgi:hypothetical protein
MISTCSASLSSHSRTEVAAVRDTFADAWDKPPRQSRLMHGVGIASLGFVMDAILDRYSRNEYQTRTISPTT